MEGGNPPVVQVNASQRGLWELSNSWINGYWGAARMNDLRQQLVSQMRSIHEGSLREGEVNQEVQELQETWRRRVFRVLMGAGELAEVVGLVRIGALAPGLYVLIGSSGQRNRAWQQQSTNVIGSVLCAGFRERQRECCLLVTCRGLCAVSSECECEIPPTPSYCACIDSCTLVN